MRKLRKKLSGLKVKECNYVFLFFLKGLILFFIFFGCYANTLKCYVQKSNETNSIIKKKSKIEQGGESRQKIKGVIFYLRVIILNI